MEKKYPYQHKELTSLSGEEWRDIKGFEGLYQVSNLGRVKSLDRYVKHKSGKLILVRSQIISQTIYRYYNKFTKDYTYALRVAFSVEGKRFDFQVRRLVYQAFVGKLDPKQCVINVDQDGFNNRVTNINMVPTSVKQKRVNEGKRTISFLAYADRSKFKQIGGNRRKVGRFQQGKLIKSYESITAASRQSGFSVDQITDIAKGRKPHYKGVSWKYL